MADLERSLRGALASHPHRCLERALRDYARRGFCLAHAEWDRTVSGAAAPVVLERRRGSAGHQHRRRGPARPTPEILDGNLGPRIPRTGGCLQARLWQGARDGIATTVTIVTYRILVRPRGRTSSWQYRHVANKGDKDGDSQQDRGEVTGAATGIGRALALASAAGGARGVAVADLDARGAQEVAPNWPRPALDCRWVFAQQVDVADAAAVRALADEATQRFGQIDVFCSNAGIILRKGLDASAEEWQRIWEINVMAHIHAARAVLHADAGAWRWPFRQHRIGRRAVVADRARRRMP
ncbi:SDR family NAD(P)-dependent oxidoreductase [Cupriavidus basilensis]